MAGIPWSRLNGPAKATIVAALVISLIGSILLAIVLVAQNRDSADSTDTNVDAFIVNGLRDFTLSSSSGSFWNMRFYTSENVTSCQAHVDSLNITHVETGSRESLRNSWCPNETLSDWFALYMETYIIGDFRPDEDWGTYTVTSGYPTWVEDLAIVYEAQKSANELSPAFRVVGIVGVVMILLGTALCLVVGSCRGLSVRRDISQFGPDHPVAAGASPPAYTGGVQVPVVVMAQVVGQGEESQKA
ncbi:unnamed protein product [Symbiodinium sp. CCMP2592]|nr:unnamed protein product [Symbiodinium sp. CCMP2592]